MVLFDAPPLLPSTLPSTRDLQGWGIFRLVALRYIEAST